MQQNRQGTGGVCLCLWLYGTWNGRHMAREDESKKKKKASLARTPRSISYKHRKSKECWETSPPSVVLFINTYHKLVSGYNQTEQMFYYQSPATFNCLIFPSCFIHFFHHCSRLSRVCSPLSCIILRLCVSVRLIVNLRRPHSERVK